MSKLIISGWKEGLQKISLTKIIRSYTGLGLAEGKERTDAVLERKIVVFENLKPELALQFLEEIDRIGAIARVEEE